MIASRLLVVAQSLLSSPTLKLPIQFMIYVVDKKLKWKNLINQPLLIYLASEQGIDTKEALIFELMKIVDQEFSYIGDLPLEIRQLADIHSFKLSEVTFESENVMIVKSFLLSYQQIFTLKQFEEWFTHLHNWQDIFNSMIANNVLISCKSGFKSNPLLPSLPLLDPSFTVLGPICKALLQSSKKVFDPIVGDLEAADSDSDDWMSE